MSTNNFTFKNILIAFGDEYAETFEEFVIPEIQSELLLKFPEGKECYEWLDRTGKKFFEVPVYKNGELYKTVVVFWRTGYYAGANIDYDIIEAEDDTLVTVAAEFKVNKIVTGIVEILRRHGTELKKVGQFSNGEAVYEKAPKSATFENLFGDIFPKRKPSNYPPGFDVRSLD